MDKSQDFYVGTCTKRQISTDFFQRSLADSHFFLMIHQTPTETDVEKEEEAMTLSIFILQKKLYNF